VKGKEIMSTGAIILLGAFAGLTIYLGLPLVFLRQIPQKAKVFLSMFATGILLFLLFVVVSKASEPINEALGQLGKVSAATGTFLLDVFLLILGIGLGSLGLVYFQRLLVRWLQPSVTAPVSTEDAVTGPSSSPQVTGGTTSDLSARTLALLIATGIGLHNFSEGLAIVQSAATGALQLAIVLLIGFGLHNMTEGFGIIGPLGGQSVSWKFVGLLGLIGGGPTFLGTVIGIIFVSPQIFILFLALAAGAIIYVVTELLGGVKRYKVPEIVMWGIVGGFLLGYLTDLIVTLGGA
jgi:zinc transporter, ZIP family